MSTITHRVKQIEALLEQVPDESWAIGGKLGEDFKGHVPVDAVTHMGLLERRIHQSCIQVVYKAEDDERSPLCEARANYLIAVSPHNIRKLILELTQGSDSSQALIYTGKPTVFGKSSEPPANPKVNPATKPRLTLCPNFFCVGKHAWFCKSEELQSWVPLLLPLTTIGP